MKTRAGRAVATTLLIAAAATLGARGEGAFAEPPPTAAAPGQPLGQPSPELVARERMVAMQIARRGVKDKAVLRAMAQVPRHLFVPAEDRADAYDDRPLPIGEGQTISQPYIVAFMTEQAAVGPGARVLEVGTGSGYQAAVLAALGAEVYTIEIVPALGKRAAETLAALNYKNVKTRIGDGYLGWPEAAPFDAIVVTAAPPEVPAPLLQQLKVGGRMVIPVGESAQALRLITRKGERDYQEKSVLPVRFVPMTGKAQERRSN
jgi:protein-L-isoaspartate(D-aspartate) O-methyltransferase